MPSAGALIFSIWHHPFKIINLIIALCCYYWKVHKSQMYSQMDFSFFKKYLHPRIYLLIWERERDIYRERDGERGTLMSEKHWWIASFMQPNGGLNQQPRYVPWLGTESATFWCRRQCSNKLSHQAKVLNGFFKKTQSRERKLLAHENPLHAPSSHYSPTPHWPDSTD